MNKQFKLLYVISAAAAIIVILTVLYLDNKFTPASSGAIVSDNVKIVLDAGHGGFDGGAVCSDGTMEKDINLSISLKLKDMLEFAGFEVIMTRTDDSSTADQNTDGRSAKSSDIKNRLKLAEETPNSILLSIHQNKYSESKYWGAQVFYGGNNEESRAFAQTLQSTITSMLQPENTREIKQSTKDIYILYNANCPAVLVECGFLSNPEEAQKLQTDEYQSQMAFAVMCASLEQYGADGSI